MTEGWIYDGLLIYVMGSKDVERSVMLEPLLHGTEKNGIPLIDKLGIANLRDRRKVVYTTCD